MPISLDLDIKDGVPEGDEGIKIKDRFMWNANEPFYQPLEFAKIFCRDVGISDTHAETISNLIKAQIEEAQNTVVIDLGTQDATPDDVEWDDDVAMHEDDERWVEPDCRIIINVSVPPRTLLTLSSTCRSSRTSCATASSGTSRLPSRPPNLLGTTAPSWA